MVVVFGVSSVGWFLQVCGGGVAVGGYVVLCAVGNVYFYFVSSSV